MYTTGNNTYYLIHRGLYIYTLVLVSSNEAYNIRVCTTLPLKSGQIGKLVEKSEIIEPYRQNLLEDH